MSTPKGLLLPNSSQIPDLILDRWMGELSGAEFKLTMYVARRTYGFRREADDISIAQMVGGLVTKQGNRLDNGTGLSRETVTKTITSLIGKGILLRTRHSDQRGGDLPSTYRLNLNSTFGSEEMGKKHTGVRKSDSHTTDDSDRKTDEESDSPQSENLTPAPPKNLTPLGSENLTHNKQSLDIQSDTHTDKQQQTDGSAVVPLEKDADVPGRENCLATLIAERVECSKSDALAIIADLGIEVAQRQLGLWHTRAKNPRNPGGYFRQCCANDWPDPAEGKQRARTEDAARRDSRVVRAPDSGDGAGRVAAMVDGLAAHRSAASAPSQPIETSRAEERLQREAAQARQETEKTARAARREAIHFSLSPCALRRLRNEAVERLLEQMPSKRSEIEQLRIGGEAPLWLTRCLENQITAGLDERADAPSLPVTSAERAYYDAADAQAAGLNSNFE